MAFLSSVPTLLFRWSTNPSYTSSIRRDAKRHYRVNIRSFGHVGDANNHVNLLPATREQADRGEALIHEFAEFIVAHKGTIAAEHGVGKTKVDLLQMMYPGDEIPAMKAVKRRLDPLWLLGRDTIFVK